MGEKAEFLFGEGLISTAFLGGVWSAIELDPEMALIKILGELLATIAGPETAATYIGIGRLGLIVAFLAVVAMVYAIGRKLGLAALGVMWLAGSLFIQGHQIGVLLLLIGWGLGALAIIFHTDEKVTAPQRREYGRV